MFEPIEQHIGDRLEGSITEGISKWLPYVTIQNIFVTMVDETNPINVIISIEFSVDVEDADVVENITFNFNSVNKHEQNRIWNKCKVSIRKDVNYIG